MELIEGLYLVTTTVLAGASVTLLAFAVSAYRSSGRTAMAYLAVGFGLVVLAAVATPVAAFRTSFANPQALLLVNTGLLAASMALVAGSLAVYEPGTREFVIPTRSWRRSKIAEAGRNSAERPKRSAADQRIREATVRRSHARASRIRVPTALDPTVDTELSQIQRR